MLYLDGCSPVDGWFSMGNHVYVGDLSSVAVGAGSFIGLVLSMGVISSSLVLLPTGVPLVGRSCPMAEVFIADMITFRQLVVASTEPRDDHQGRLGGLWFGHACGWTRRLEQWLTSGLGMAPPSVMDPPWCGTAPSAVPCRIWAFYIVQVLPLRPVVVRCYFLCQEHGGGPCAKVGRWQVAVLHAKTINGEICRSRRPRVAQCPLTHTDKTFSSVFSFNSSFPRETV